MKRKELTDLRKKDLKALEESLADKMKAKFEALKSSFSGKEKNLKVMANLKREISQIKTLITEKKIMERIETK